MGSGHLMNACGAVASVRDASVQCVNIWVMISWCSVDMQLPPCRFSTSVLVYLGLSPPPLVSSCVISRGVSR